MQLIQTPHASPPPKSWKEDSFLNTKIQAIFASLRISAQFFSSSQTSIKFTIELKCRSTERPIISVWTFTQGDYLQIRVQSCYEGSGDSAAQNVGKMKDVIRMMNSGSYGVYFTQASSPTKLMFRQRFPFQTTRIYLSSYIRELFIQVSVQFRKFAVNCKLIPTQEEPACKKIGDTLLRLKLLKEHFQFSRQQRKNHTNSYNLTNNSIKAVSQSLQLINLCIGKLKTFLWENKVDLARSNKIYQACFRLIDEGLNKQRQSLPNYIVRAIMIEESSKQQNIDEGGFSDIKIATYTFSQLSTLYSNTLDKLIECSSADQLQTRVLVRKLPKNPSDISHMNEYELLKFLRNKKDKALAQYFLSSSNHQQYNKGIYMQFYQSNLVKTYQQLKQADLLKICRQILEGIFFLWQNKVLHRDLKELNILIDQSCNAKLIDFGSACGFASNSGGQFKAYSNKLMATKGYFFSYKEIPFAGIQKKFTMEQYHQAETFDMYSFGQILNNLFSLHNLQDTLLHRQLTFLSRRCQQINPDDRIYPHEALCYFHQIIKMHDQLNRIQAQQVPSNTSESSQNRSTKSTSQQ